MNSKRAWNTFLDILFPPQCVSCGEKLKASAEGNSCLCARCFAAIPVYSGFFCPVCKRRLPEPHLTCHHEAGFVLAAATDYESQPVRELIHFLKYKSLTAVTTPLAEILKTYIEKSFGDLSFEICHSILVPVPLHPRRERERGYNQVTLVLEKLRTQFPAFPEPKTSVLVRAKPTRSQIEMKTHEERTENVRGCFRVAEPDEIKGRNVLHRQ